MPNSTLQSELDVASHAGAGFFCEHFQTWKNENPGSSPRILVAGCGAGHEAALIQQLLEAKVEAVDVENELLPKFSDWQDLNYQVASVCDLPFSENTFDGIFYHHVIEHVDDPAKSLAELSRVLKPGGQIFVGTPNRHRLVSSVGAHKQTQWDPTWQNKLRDNVRDWSARLQGRFRNEYGAHAGFSRSELSHMLSKNFVNQQWVTKQYLKYKYLNHRYSRAVSLIASRPFSNIGSPSIYVFATGKTN